MHVQRGDDDTDDDDGKLGMKGALNDGMKLTIRKFENEKQ